MTPVPDSPQRTKGWVMSAVLAGLCVIMAFSSPLLLVIAVILGGYSYYLFKGGRDITGVMPDGRPRPRAWLAWAVIALIALTTISLIGLLIGLAFGGYAAYLFTGHRDVTREGPDGTPRSAVWMYWGGISLCAFACLVTDPLSPLHVASWAAAIAWLGAAAYAIYLVRGGRFVFWFGG